MAHSVAERIHLFPTYAASANQVGPEMPVRWRAVSGGEDLREYYLIRIHHITTLALCYCRDPHGQKTENLRNEANESFVINDVTFRFAQTSPK
jgi:hypothetical protein